MMVGFQSSVYCSSSGIPVNLVSAKNVPESTNMEFTNILVVPELPETNRTETGLCVSRVFRVQYKQGAIPHWRGLKFWFFPDSESVSFL